MSTLNQDLNAIKAVEDTLTANKVANFAYTQEAYDNNDADGVEEYDFDQEQNIPVGSLSVLRVNETVLTKGWRSQASAITRMLMNHFLGRLSYNLNKITDIISNLLATLIAKAGNADGFATLDSNGRIPYSQLPESAIEYKGQWDADTNTPTLADGTGTKGDFYIVSVAGTQDLGSGDIQFFVNDRVIYDGSVWSRLSAGDVKSVNNITPVNGNITLTKADVGLGNVDNTSDSDLPALNGTNKFTTAGAYNTLISISPAFDAEQAYEVGNYVTYQGRLYKCTSAHTGAWDITDFTLISIGEDLEKVAPLNYLLDTEQDQFKKWIDGKEVYRKVKQVDLTTSRIFTGNTASPYAVYALGKYRYLIFLGTANHGIYLSSDGGLNFAQITDISTTCTVSAMQEFNDKMYFATSIGLLCLSLDDNSWSTVVSSVNFTSLVVYQGYLLAGASNSLYKVDTEQTVTYTSYTNMGRFWALLEFNGTLYAGLDSHGIYTSTDGITFTQNTSYPTNITAYAFGIYNNILYVGSAQQGIYTSTDGSTFTQNTSFPTNVSVRCFYVFLEELYVGTDSNKGLYLSSDGVIFTKDDSLPNYSYRAFLENKGLFIGSSQGAYRKAVFPASAFPNLTVDQSVDSLIDLKLVVDGSNVNPSFAQKLGNQINLAILSDAQSALFPTFDVYAVLEYTKP